MKKSLVVAAVAVLSLVACKKDECHACHYEINEVEVEIGTKCGDDLKQAEKEGILVDGVKYDVHCHDH